MFNWPDLSAIDELTRDPHPPVDRQAGAGSSTGTPTPHAQNHSKPIDNFSTQAENTQVGGSHYKNLKIQPMRYSYMNGLNAPQHTAIKYITRYKDKEGIKDLRKAIHCIELLIQYELENKNDNKEEKVCVDHRRGRSDSGALPPSGRDQDPTADEEEIGLGGDDEGGVPWG